MKKNFLSVLVVGGAGYIGSHMVKMLGQLDVNVTTLDNLSTGYMDSVKSGNFILGDISDVELLTQIFKENKFDVVMHFASNIQVGESILSPSKYYQNNLVNTLKLLDAMIVAKVGRFIFSSTAAVFGEPLYTPIDESHPKLPINPYGQSKLMVEKILADYDKAYGLKSAILRYFNAAGADPEGLLGERHIPETHLIPLALQVASGRKKEISIYGTDYDSFDGTCIRDYIHVWDLCNAHWLALNSLIASEDSRSYNLGNGTGFSVKQVIDMVGLVTGKDIKVCYKPRRHGDPVALVSDSSYAREVLGWSPSFSTLRKIIEDAWYWEMHGSLIK
jgi:UDP-glucose 4-epimerase